MTLKVTDSQYGGSILKVKKVQANTCYSASYRCSEVLYNLGSGS